MPSRPAIPTLSRFIASVAVCGAFSLCLAPFGLRARPAAATELRHTAIVRAVQGARPSVVNIHGQKRVAGDGVGPATRRVNGMGTGVVVDERGYILTNYHVVEGVARIQVTLHDKRSYVAEIVAYDARTDLAIIKVPATKDMQVIRTGTSSDLMLGEPVIALGNAYGYEHTVTRGIISALHRDVPISETQRYEDLIQTDASINPGNSGGPLLNADGEMIGIVVAVRVGAQGIGFAIPVDKAMSVASKLLSTEQIDRHWHGLVGVSKISDAAREFVVQSVQAGGPAEKAGLLPRDVVLEAAGRKIARRLDFERALLGRAIDEEVPVKIRRGEQILETKLAIAAMPNARPTTVDKAWSALGIRLEPMSLDEFRRINKHYRGGLRVMAVRPGSSAAALDIKPGDVLVGLHIWETISLDNVAYVLGRADFAQLAPLKFHILRGQETIYRHVPVVARVSS